MEAAAELPQGKLEALTARDIVTNARGVLADILSLHGYNLVRHINTGSQGSVYLCRSHRDSLEYAVKVGKNRATIQELEALKTVWAPNVIYIYETFVEHGLTFIVLEYCPGGSLADLLRAGPVPRERLLAMCEQLTNALRACHSANMAHGDIKPHNVLIDKHGRVKLADFGLAQVHENCASTQFKGSLAYIAPEVLLGEVFDPFRADIWSLGVTFYEMATGKLPWAENLRPDEFYDHIIGGIRTIDPTVPKALADLMRMMVVADPAGRIRLDQIDVTMFRMVVVRRVSSLSGLAPAPLERASARSRSPRPILGSEASNPNVTGANSVVLEPLHRFTPRVGLPRIPADFGPAAIRRAPGRLILPPDFSSTKRDARRFSASATLK
jgi:serine/threonine protein kinase